MPIIEQVRAREILDSRGNPTVEVEVDLITALAGKPRQHIGITNPSPPGEDGRGRNTTIKERQP